jgi:hypothetical protein
VAPSEEEKQKEINSVDIQLLLSLQSSGQITFPFVLLLIAVSISLLTPSSTSRIHTISWVLPSIDPPQVSRADRCCILPTKLWLHKRDGVVAGFGAHWTRVVEGLDLESLT